MIGESNIFEALMPGHTAKSAPNFRHRLRHGLYRRLHMFSLLLQTRPERCDDPASFKAMLEELQARPSHWRDRFLNDVDVAAWITTIGHKPTLGQLVCVAPFRELLDQHLRLSACASNDDWQILVFTDDAPANLSNAVKFVQIKQNFNVQKWGFLTEEKIRLHHYICSILDSISLIWPGMAEMIRHHIRAAVVGHGHYAASSKRFIGSVMWGDDFINNPTLGSGQYFAVSLVHEAVHQALYCIEEEFAFTIPGAKAQFISTWSGEDRDLSVYSHIPLVYYMIAEYLCRLRDRELGILPVISEKICAIVKGLDAFYVDEVGRPYMSPLVRAMHDQIRAALEKRRACFLS